MMRKIIAIEWLSLDGFIAGTNGEIDWFVWNEEIEEYSKEVMSSSDTMLFGRLTYELMAAYWPTPASDSENKIITDFMNNSPKVVFSKTISKVEWNNTSLFSEIDSRNIIEMKQNSGKDILIYGSGSIVSQLSKMKLMDEYRIFLNPVVLGNRKPLFQNVVERCTLNLVNTKSFKGGNVLLQYSNNNS